MTGRCVAATDCYGVDSDDEDNTFTKSSQCLYVMRVMRTHHDDVRRWPSPLAFVMHITSGNPVDILLRERKA